MPQARIPEQLAMAGRRFGYAVAIGINVLMIWIVGNLLDWELVEFLEPEFADLVPVIQLGLWVTIAANAVYLYDDRSFSARAARLVVDVVNLYVTARVFEVFPFDFTAHAVDWALVFRALLLIAVVGSAVSGVVHLGRLLKGGPVSNEERHASVPR